MSERSRYIAMSALMLGCGAWFASNLPGNAQRILSIAAGLVASPLLVFYVRWNTRGSHLRHNARSPGAIWAAVGVALTIGALTRQLGPDSAAWLWALLTATCIAMFGGGLATFFFIDRWWPQDARPTTEAPQSNETSR